MVSRKERSQPRKRTQGPGSLKDSEPLKDLFSYPTKVPVSNVEYRKHKGRYHRSCIIRVSLTENLLSYSLFMYTFLLPLTRH